MRVRERASRMWSVLIRQAATGQTITYGRLAPKVGNHAGGQGLGPALNHISDHCEATNQPDLSVIVVRQDTGKPGHTRVADVDAEQERVFAHKWPFGS